MNLSSSIDYTLLQNKFLKLMVVSWFWDFGRSRDQKEFGGSGIHGEFDGTGVLGFLFLSNVVSFMNALNFIFVWNNICYNDIDINFSMLCSCEMWPFNFNKVDLSWYLWYGWCVTWGLLTLP